jgi:hypothetical protein
MTSVIPPANSQVDSALDRQNHRTGAAWLLLCLALALHVTDEALTGFLNVYNPTVIALREKAPWLPLPTFNFTVWLAGLILAVAVLSILSIFVFRGDRWIRYLAYFFAIMMIGNALVHTIGTVLGHTAQTIRFPRPMPGFYSSPFLLVASIYLLVQLRRQRTTDQTDDEIA